MGRQTVPAPRYDLPFLHCMPLLEWGTARLQPPYRSYIQSYTVIVNQSIIQSIPSFISYQIIFSYQSMHSYQCKSCLKTGVGSFADFNCVAAIDCTAGRLTPRRYTDSFINGNN